VHIISLNIRCNIINCCFKEYLIYGPLFISSDIPYIGKVIIRVFCYSLFSLRRFNNDDCKYYYCNVLCVTALYTVRILQSMIVYEENICVTQYSVIIVFVLFLLFIEETNYILLFSSNLPFVIFLTMYVY